MSEILLWGDYTCELCINIMEEMSRMSSISYGTLNILLFVIMGPLATLVFMVNSLIQLIFKDKYKILNIILFILGLVLIAAVVLPVIYVFFFGKF